jgi:alpha-ketoglutarate-dependent taurine dioxygenase
MTGMVTTSDLDVRLLSPIIGAEIYGVDISRPLGESVVAAVRDTLNRYHVVFFRDQEMTPDEQEAFAQQFGEVTEAHPVITSIEGNSKVLAIDAQRGDRASWWHTDVTFVDTPALGSILYMREIPEVGGDTMWASLQDAYDRLAPPMRELCDKLIAVHHDPWFAAEVDEMGGYNWNGEFHEKLTPAIHPVVRTHPETGRKGLFVNKHFTQLIIGLSDIESDGLLSVLYQQSVLPEITCRFRWQEGSVAFWDNRATMHYALDDYGDARRLGHRVTLRGDRPFGPAMPPVNG